MGGWLRKEVRNRAHRLEKLLLTEMTFNPKGAVLRLRASVDEDATGFDVELDADGARVRLVRVGEQGDPIEPSEADAAKLFALHAKLRESALEIPQQHARLEEAKLDERSVAELRDPAIVVDRLVAAMTPIVSEISQHSLSPTELVLKRLLGDNRREEIFVSKATLSEKLAVLPEPLRGNFEPLGLNRVSLRPARIPTSIPPRPSRPRQIPAPAGSVAPARVESASDAPLPGVSALALGEPSSLSLAGLALAAHRGHCTPVPRRGRSLVASIHASVCRGRTVARSGQNDRSSAAFAVPLLLPIVASRAPLGSHFFTPTARPAQR